LAVILEENDPYRNPVAATPGGKESAFDKEEFI
jgi:hypothetical protein